jgi:DNA polymerase III delta prime subunit
MRDFIVKTNFGYTYRWTAENIAKDYVSTAIQWQDEEDKPKTEDDLYQQIVNDEDFLTQWFNDYIRSDIAYSVSQAKLIAVDQEQYNRFVEWAIDYLGAEV